MNTSGLEAVLPEGFTDVETIERLANWFFQAPPGVADGAPLDALNPLAGTLPPVIGIPGEAELRALLTHVNSLPQASSPPFYFLEYAQPARKR